MQHLLAANITESGICDFCRKYNTHAVFSPERERQTEEKWNFIKPLDLTTKYQEIQGTGEHVNDTTEIHSTTSRL